MGERAAVFFVERKVQIVVIYVSTSYILDMSFTFDVNKAHISTILISADSFFERAHQRRKGSTSASQQLFFFCCNKYIMRDP